MTSDQLKEKIKYGDYNTLGQVLGITSDAAKMRFKRNDAVAIEAMTKIIEGRDQLIKEYQTIKNK
jgi:hypothetical protein